MQHTVEERSSRSLQRGVLALLMALACALAFAAVLPATARAATSSQTSRYALSALDTEYTIDVDDDGYVYVSFTPSTSGYYAIQTVGEDDTYGFLYDAAGTLLVKDDDGGDDANALLLYYFEAGTTYYADLTFYDVYKGYGDPANSTITVSVSELEVSTLTDSVDVLETTTAGIAYYVFTPSESGIYEFTLSMTSTGYSYAYAYVYSSDNSGDTICWNSISTSASRTSSESTDFCTLEAGTSYLIGVCIEEEDEDGGTVTPSSVTLSVEQAAVTDISESLEGIFSVDYTFQEDAVTYFSFTPSADGVYEIVFDGSVTSSSADYCSVDCILYDADMDYVGGLYAEYEGSGVLDGAEKVILSAGETYYLALSYYADDDATFSGVISVTGPKNLSKLTVGASYTCSLDQYETTYLTFTPTTSGDYTFILNVEDEECVDAEIDVYDASGEYLDGTWLYDDDEDGGTVSDTVTLTLSLTAGETYYVLFYSYTSTSPSITLSVVQGTTISVTRLAGDNRYETAYEIAYETYWYTDSDYIILAAGNNANKNAYADALAASYAAGVLNCSVVLTKPDELSEAAEWAIEGLGASHVIIVGGTSAVSEEVEEAVAAIDGVEDVTRIAGSNRYETAALIYEEFSASASGTAILATGQEFADALCASPLSYAAGWPILLTKTDSIPAATLEALADFDNVIIVGGTSAVSQAVEDELEAMGISVTRIAGSNRYLTSVMIAEYAISEGYLSADVVGIATGTNYPDALVGGSLLGARGGVLLLTKEDSLSGDRNATALAAFLDEYGSGIDGAYILGGTAAVSKSLEEELISLVF